MVYGRQEGEIGILRFLLEVRPHKYVNLCQLDGQVVLQSLQKMYMMLNFKLIMNAFGIKHENLTSFSSLDLKSPFLFHVHFLVPFLAFKVTGERQKQTLQNSWNADGQSSSSEGIRTGKRSCKTWKKKLVKRCSVPFCMLRTSIYTTPGNLVATIRGTFYRLDHLRHVNQSTSNIFVHVLSHSNDP